MMTERNESVSGMATSRDMKPSSEIYWDLRQQLVSAAFVAGEKLKPGSLRARYGCSASTLREVLFRLSCDGFVDFVDQRGFRVPVASAKLFRELNQMRIMLECEGARLSIANGGIEWEARLNAAHHKLAHVEEKMRAADSIKPLVNVWSGCEWEFHDTLISACGSDLMRETHRTVFARHRQTIVAARNNYSFRPDNISDHKAILDAALARDPDLCIRTIRTHLEKNLRYV